MAGILQGMRVVEGSAFVAIPLAGMTLAQMGADVIRFDRLEGGLDATRLPLAPNGQSLFWAGLNKGKRSIAIDMKNPRAREIIPEIICAPGDDAGLFLTNLRVRGWMDYETLSARRADLVMVTLLGDRMGRPQVDYTVNPAVGFPRCHGARGLGRARRPCAARMGLYRRKHGGLGPAGRRAPPPAHRPRAGGGADAQGRGRRHAGQSRHHR